MINTNVKWNGAQYCEAGFDNVSPLKVAGKSVLAAQREVWSPVHMLVSAVESCFMVTFMAVAERARLKVTGYESNTIGEMSSTDGKHYAISKIVIKPKVKLENPEDMSRLPALFVTAKEHCVVANSLNFKTEVVSA